MIDTVFGPSGLVLLGGLLCIVGAFWASQKRGDFERQLKEKNEQIIELTKDAADSVIGGDSFCHMYISGINLGTNAGLLVFVHHGKHPLYDVKARVYDPQKILNKPMNYDTLVAANTNVDLGGIPVGAAVQQGQCTLPSAEKSDLNIFFSARNGFFTQFLRLRKVNGKWCSAVRVMRGPEKIFEDIDKDFPVDAANIANWDDMQ